MRYPFACDIGRSQREPFVPGVQNTHWGNLPPVLRDSNRRVYGCQCRPNRGELPGNSCLYLCEHL